MGTVSEGFSPEFLKKRYGGYITDLLEPTEDGMTVNACRGMVSDDFSVAYYTADVLIEENSRITRELAVKGLLRWWGHPEYTCYAGPSTRKGIMRLIDPEHAEAEKDALKCENRLATNGGGMKAGIMGVFNPCDPEAAIRDTIIMCGLTHNNPIALSAACAVSAATAQAFEENTSYLDILRAGLYGAREGYRKTVDTYLPIAGGNVEKRMQLAIDLGMKYQGDFERAMIEIADTVGCGLYAYEAIPGMFGMLAACKGDWMKTICMSVNAGSDADSTACMAGYILGALHGCEAVPRGFWKLIDEKNGFDLENMAIQIDRLCKEESCHAG